jgi:hypothetical protein
VFVREYGYTVTEHDPERPSGRVIAEDACRRVSLPPGFCSDPAWSRSSSGAPVASEATKGQPRMIASARVGRSGSRERASRDGWARSPSGPCGAQADNQLG